MAHDVVLNKIADIRRDFPDNRAIQCFDPAYFAALDDAMQARLLKCINSGLENPHSEMGCYAGHPMDYSDLRPFFSEVLSGHHGVDTSARHQSDWDLSTVQGLPDNGVLDFSAFGLPPLSIRIRVGRNLADFPLAGSMTRQDRLDMEHRMERVFDQLADMPEFRGEYRSLTPGHPKQMSDQEYRDLIDAHIMFKPLEGDHYLRAAGISNDWPHGRGCFVSNDGGFIIWIGEEDHLRIMCMAKTTVLSAVFARLRATVDALDATGALNFVISEDYGVVTSCPTNLGTAMRASVHLPLPHLIHDGSDEMLKAEARRLGLAVRGLGGEHTKMGNDGTVDISPSARFCITEAQIIARLYHGVGHLAGLAATS